MRHIREKQEGGGLWQAYWWDGQMFATYHCLRTLLLGAREPLGDESRRDLIANITAQQSAYGTWGDETTGKNLAFETALALRTLLVLHPDLANSDSVTRAILWLLKYQGPDGSWDSRPMLRVPEGNDKDPWMKREWRLDMANGVGILVRDQNRSFTTATVLAALTHFLECAGDRQLVATRKKELQAVA
jgi:squalene-hopene/tetraprenyl-beta-curcumene cyclase